MIKTQKNSWLLATAAFLCLAGSAIAQTVEMKLTGAGGNIYAGVYVNPYTATIDGVTTTVICNDFSASTWVGQEWDATVTYLDGDLTQTKQGAKWMSSGGTLAGLTQHYYAAAYLSTMLLSAPTAHQAALISFAIWGMFDPSALSWMQSKGVSQTDIDAVFGANGLKNNALAEVGSGALNFDPSKVAVYSPVADTATGCPGGCTGKNSPQEFITVKTPEPSALSQLGIDLLGFGSVFALVLRRRKGMCAGLHSR